MTSPSMTRRSLLGAAGAATVGLGLAACTPGGGSGGPNAASDPTGGSAPGSSFEMPAFTPYEGVTPDLPAAPNGAAPYFEKLPAEPPAYLDEAVGSGEDVTIYSIVSAPLVPVEQNPRWQSLNDMLGVNLQIQGATPGDFADKFQTMVAGNTLPDVTCVLTTLTPQLPSMLPAKFTDLTEYLAGDAINDYPALANMPTYNWSGGSIFDDKIFLIPKPNFALFRTYMIREDIAEERGLNTAPADGEELEELLAGFTDVSKNQFATTAWEGLLDMVNEMMGTPNAWAEEDGKFTNAYETENFAEALATVARFGAAGYLHPDTFSDAIKSQATAMYNGGQMPFWPVTASWGFRAANTELENPEARSVTIPLRAWDGSGPCGRWLGAGTPYRIGIPKTDPDRVKQLLRLIDALSAPFGTKEYTEITYGVEGVDYTRDSDGIVQVTDEGATNNITPVMYAGDSVPVHYGVHPGYAKLEYEQEKADMDHAVDQPQVDYQSTTDQSKGAELRGRVTDTIRGVIQGRSTMDDWTRAVDEWRQNGGDTIRAEYEASFEAGNS